jgi:hypothetical protein
MDETCNATTWNELSNICTDTTWGLCHKVIITYSGGDGVKNPLDLTWYLKDKCFSKFVFEQIKACINPAIYNMAVKGIQNEMTDPRNGYPATLSHKYPIEVTDNEKTLKVSLVLLDNIPSDIRVADGLFELCDLKREAVPLADSVLNKTKYFIGQKEGGKIELDKYNIGEDKDNPPALTSGNYVSTIEDEDDGYYHDGLGMSLFSDTLRLNLSPTRMALICFAKTTRGKKVLGEINANSTPYCHTGECEERNLHMQYDMDTRGQAHTLYWIGRGRFNPFSGYMPGGVIFAHEIGHTYFGGEYSDYAGGPGRNLMKHNNLAVNENPMRKAYGMSLRQYYTVVNYKKHSKVKDDKTTTLDKLGCYDEHGIRTECPEYIGYLLQFKSEYATTTRTVESKDRQAQTPYIWSK